MIQLFTNNKRICILLILMEGIIVSLACCNTHTKKDDNKFQEWDSKQIHKNMLWRSRHFDNLYGNSQYINLLDIELKDAYLYTSVAYQDSLLLPTHEMAQRENALAAINGNFFHTEEGGSVCYLKVNGKLADTSRTDLTESLFLDELDDAAIIIDSTGMPDIIACPVNGWNSKTDVPTIISAGPPMLLDGKEVKLNPHLFNNNRFSRTGAGLTKDNHLLLVTVDGNTNTSAGMTIAEFTKLFQWLGCIKAINLDGGGSTTMYIKGQPDNGIVNHPTDNKKFDHFGERKVANAIIIKSR